MALLNSKSYHVYGKSKVQTDIEVFNPFGLESLGLKKHGIKPDSLNIADNEDY